MILCVLVYCASSAAYGVINDAEAECIEVSADVFTLSRSHGSVRVVRTTSKVNGKC